MSAGPEPPKSIRAFLALELPEPLRAELGRVIHTLRPQLRGVRWVDASGIHLTLRFLGWTAPDRLARVQARAEAAVAGCPSVDVSLDGLGMFPQRGSPRVLWVGMDVPEPVRALQAACEAAAIAEGFEPEARPFHPHLTLGRWKDRTRRPSLAPVSLGHWTLDRLVLYQSQPGPGGSTYTPLATFPLG